MSISSELSENAARTVFRVTGECLTASKSIEGFAHSDPEKRKWEKANYEQHLLEAIASALAIDDEFYKGLAIHKVINLCRSSNDLDIAKTLFKEVDHPSLREQIVRDAPELAGERRTLFHEENGFPPVTIHLDGLDHEAVVHLVTKAMRDIGSSEREVEGFTQDASNADFDTTLAKAIDWGAPVCFLKDGKPWVKGDWKRLTLWQRLKRRFSLWGGSFVHPDGTIELPSRRG
jgi:hypothetical protein